MSHQTAHIEKHSPAAQGKPPTDIAMPKMKASYFGLCLAMFFSSAFFIHTADSIKMFEGFASYGFYTVQIAAFLAFALAAPSFSDNRARHLLAIGSGFGACLGVVLTVASQSSSAIALPLFLAGTMLTAVGSSALQLCWMRLYARLGTLQVLVCYSGSMLLSALIQSALSPAPYVVGTLAIAVSPLVSAALLARARRAMPAGTDQRALAQEWSFPYRPIILFGIFSFVYKVSLNLLPEADKPDVIAFGTLAGAIAILAAAATLRKKLDIRFLYLASLPFAIAGLLCVMGTPYVSANVGVMLIVIARELFSVFMATILCNICFRNEIDAFWMFGLLNAASRTASLLANWTTETPLNGSDPQAIYLFLSGATVMLVCLFMLFVSDRSTETIWGIRKKEQPQVAPQNDMDIALHKLARACNLTLREEEVALLRLQNATIASIADRLFISQATVKTHVNRIYHKTDTHSVDELSNLVEQYR